ncbi:ribonuclease E/G [Lacibacterium aquatile]|uniref:Ribonuclease E/G n=1 Tax=Lacibacterium aquatile TaxID=1168082 RepID=A0ABW5DWS0_9PROT
MSGDLPDSALVASVSPGELRAGRIEAGRLTEILIERGGDASGEVRRAILRARDDASGGGFLDIGEGQQAYIAHPGDDPLGAHLLVQIVKPAIGDKRAEARRRIEITGDALILTPLTPGVEISRRIEKADRQRLKVWAEAQDGHLTIRTAAASMETARLDRELAGLQQRWSLRKADGAPGVALAAPDPLERVLATLDDGSSPIFVSGRRLAGFDGRIRLLPPGQEVFSHFALEEELEAALSPTVALPGGGRLHLAVTRMATTIDIDTAGASDGGEVARQAMLEAARQIRLRNLAGLILIDPPRGGGRDRLLSVLRGALEADPLAPVLHGFTRAGLIEITRPRLRPSLAEVMLAPAVPTLSTASLVLALLRRAVQGPLPLAVELSRVGDMWLSGEGAGAWADLVRQLGHAPRRLVRQGAPDHYGRLIFPGEE